MSIQSGSQENKMLFGHPIGLFVLFFTEMWERFSYYGMRALLVLYLVSSVDKGGLAWSNASALELYGWYTMLVYVMSIPGGIIADKFLGQKKSVLYGGIILCVGHGILAIEQMWAFYSGLALIIAGVGMLKPNISTMVGGLYKDGDTKRDKGFTIFYIGINLGAFLSALIVGTVGEEYGWHYGFGLAGIGMILGLIVYVVGQKHLGSVGDFIGKSEDPKVIAAKDKPLSKIEKNRVAVLIISFLIIIVFWGAFEQAGGLLNIYAKEKINLSPFGSGWEMPVTWFQSFNALFIIIFGSLVAGIWARRQRKGKESSTLLKMGLGTIIMGLGFLMMAGASSEASEIAYGKAGFWWLTGAYFLHTIGELCASPTALSFITKLAPVKYASIMMGAYFAATGFGSKLAAGIGEASQSEPVKIEFIGGSNDLVGFDRMDTLVSKDSEFAIKSKIYIEDGNVVAKDLSNDLAVLDLLKYTKEGQESDIFKALEENGVSKDSPFHATFKFEKDGDVKNSKENVVGDAKAYSGTFILEELQSEKEYSIFMFIFYLTLGFGLVVIMFLKPLKSLTHGAEDLNIVEDHPDDHTIVIEEL